MFGLATDAQREQRIRNAELRDWEQSARAMAIQERDFQMTEADRYANQLLEERRFEIDRQVRADQEAARIQAFRLEQMLTNQRLSAEERNVAHRELERVQQIASEERTEDLRRLYEDRERATIQRDFMMGVFEDTRGALRDDQQRDLALRDRLTGQIDSLQGTVQAAFDAMGDAPMVERLTPADIEREIARRTSESSW